MHRKRQVCVDIRERLLCYVAKRGKVGHLDHAHGLKAIFPGYGNSSLPATLSFGLDCTLLHRFVSGCEVEFAVECPQAALVRISDEQRTNRHFVHPGLLEVRKTP